MGKYGRPSRALYGAMTCLFWIGFLVVMVMESGEIRATPLVPTTVGSFNSLQTTGRDKSTVHPNLDASKRRVPNGPDPIHNRRAGKSVQPPGRA